MGEGLDGIARFLMPEQGCPAFDAGPSRASVRQHEGVQRPNTQVRKSETASRAALVCEYDPAVHARQRAQPKRRAACVRLSAAPRPPPRSLAHRPSAC